MLYATLIGNYHRLVVLSNVSYSVQRKATFGRLTTSVLLRRVEVAAVLKTCVLYALLAIRQRRTN